MKSIGSSFRSVYDSSSSLFLWVFGSFVLLTSSSNASAQNTLALWNFNGPSAAAVPGGVSFPSPVLGNGSAGLIGGANAAFFSGTVDGGSSDPITTTPPNYGWGIESFPPQSTASGTAGVVFFVNTAGHNNIMVSLDVRGSPTAASRWMQYEYTANGGTTWTVFGNNGGSLTPGSVWFNQIQIDLSGIPEVNNNPVFGLKLVSIFSPVPFNPGNPDINYGPNEAYHRLSVDGSSAGPYSANGTWRFDMVRFTGECINYEPEIIADETVICAGESVTLNAFGGENFVWSTGATGNSITVNPTMTTTYTATSNINGCEAEDEITITVLPGTNDPVNLSIPQTSFCATDPPIALNNVQDGITGVWTLSGNTITTFNPAGLSGSFNLLFTPNAGQCATANTIEVTVTAGPTISPIANQVFCAGEDISIALSTTPAGANISGTNSNPAIGLPATLTNITNIAFTAGSVPNIQTGTITLTASQGGCSGSPITFDITINPAVNLTNPFAGNNTVCNTVTNLSLPNPVDGVNGTWSGTGVTGNSFNAVGLSGPINLNFTPAPGSCANLLLVTLNVTAAIVPTFSLPTSLCAGSDPLPLPTTSNNNITGTWSGPGVTNNTFNPSGLNGVTVLDFMPNPGQCATETDEQITITPAVMPTFDNFAPLCSDDDPIALPTTSNNGVQGNWSGPGITNNVFNPSGLNGSITITFIRDPGLCAQNAVRNIQVNASPIVSVSSNSPICQGGSLQLSSSGGTSFSWSGPNGFSSNLQNPTINPVTLNASGSYTVTVTNAAQCTNEGTLNVTIAPGFDADLLILQESSCAGDNNGSIDWSITGNPTGNLIANWSSPPGTNLGNTGPFNELPAGVYSVTLTDQNQCQATSTVTLNEPAALSLSCSGTDESSPSANDGSIEVIASGGVTPYNIYISPQNAPPLFIVGQGSHFFNNLPPGNYTVLIEDQNGCTEICNQTISAADCPGIQIQIIDQIAPLCFNTNDGYIAIQVLNAQEPLTYAWTPNVSTGPDAFGLSGGNYTVTVTDANDCAAQVTIPLLAPSNININCSQFSPASGPLQNDGVGQVNITGGIGPYLIVSLTGPSNPPSTSLMAGNNLLNNLLPGNYSITVSDNNGCEVSCNFTIESPDDCELEATIVILNPVQCQGDANGALQVNSVNGSGNYTYSWSGQGQGPTGMVYTGLTAATYSVTVTDVDTDCTALATFQLTEPNPISLNCSTINVSAPGESDGQINSVITGGSSPWMISWTGETSGNTSITEEGTLNISDLPAGTYTLLITDANDCTATCTVTINTQNCDELSLIMEAFGLSCAGADDGRIETVVTNANGMVTYSWSGPTEIAPGTENPTDLAEGLYTLIIEDEEGCIRNQSILVGAPLPLLLSSCGSTSANAGESDGSIIVNFTGGTGPFSILYTGPEIGLQIEESSGVFQIADLPAGMYDIVVIDTNGCSAECEVEIEERSDCDLEISCLSIDETAPDAGDGQVQITITPSDLLVTISYENQEGELVIIGPIEVEDVFTITSLVPGTYTVEVESGDCREECTFEIEAASCGLIVSCAVQSNESQPGANDGVVRINIEPGNQMIAVSYLDPLGNLIVMDPQMVEGFLILENLEPGEYTIEIDNGTCIESCSFTIQEASEGCNFEVNIEITAEILCHGDSTAGFNVTLGGNFQEPVFVLWFGPPTVIEARIGQFDNLPPGLYRIQVNDSGGCSASAQVTITQPPRLELTCETVANGTIANLNWSGGVPGYTFNLINENMDTIRNDAPLMQTSVEFPGLTPGNYEAFIIDGNGCSSDTCNFEVLPTDCMFVAQLVQTASIDCFGDATAALQVNLTGGTEPFNFAWSGPVAIGNAPGGENLPAGNYSMTVTDAEGCEAVASIIIVQPEELILSGCQQIEQASGPMEEDGSARINFSGGTAPYIIQRSGPLSDFTSMPITGISFTAFGMEPGNHTFTITDANGCQAACEVNITFEEVPCSLVINNVTIANETCPGAEDGFLEVVATSVDPMSEPITYLWSNGMTGNRIENLSGGTYFVTATDALGCEAITELTLLSAPEFDITYTLSQADCDNPFASLDISGITGSSSAYVIELEGEFYLVPPLPLSISIEPNEEESRSLIMNVDADGCEFNFDLTILPFRPLVVNGLQDRFIDRGETVTINNLVVNRNPEEISIDLSYNGIVICENCTSLSFVPNGPGIVSITVTDENRCSVTISFQIFMEALTKDVYVPTAFTPNGDNINDTFRPFDNGGVAEVVFFQIFDRWGNLIYQEENVTIDELRGWDGTLRGRLLDPGTFVYSLLVRFFDETNGRYAGEVALIK